MTEIRKAREVEKKEKRASCFPSGWGFEVRHLTPTLSPARRGRKFLRDWTCFDADTEIPATKMHKRLKKSLLL